MSRGALLRPDEVTLGRILASFGVRGEVRVYLYNRDTDLLAQGLDVDLVSPSGERQRRHLRIRPGAGKRILGQFAGVEDKDTAEALCEWEIRVEKSLLPDLDDGEYYHHELIGAEVETESGRHLGTVVEIHNAGGVDSWVVRGEGTECYVAAIKENVLQVTRGEKILVSDHVDEVL